jgi:hypothetical protein
MQTIQSSRLVVISRLVTTTKAADLMMPIAILGNQYDEMMNHKNTYSDSPAESKMIGVGFKTG